MPEILSTTTPRLFTMEDIVLNTYAEQESSCQTNNLSTSTANYFSAG